MVQVKRFCNIVCILWPMLWYHRPYLLTDLIFDLGNTYLTVWTNIIQRSYELDVHEFSGCTKNVKRLNADSSFFLLTLPYLNAPVKIAFKCFIVPITCTSIYEEIVRIIKSILFLACTLVHNIDHLPCVYQAVVGRWSSIKIQIYVNEKQMK